MASSSKDDDDPPHQEPQRASKRRRVESPSATGSSQPLFNDRPPLPPPDVLDSIIRTYFTHIQPWIPMLHIDLYPPKLKTADGLRKQEVVVHAISLAVEPHLPAKEGPLAPSSIFAHQWPARRVRNWVVTKAMDNVTLEGLQALTIVAFDDVCTSPIRRLLGRFH